MKAVRLIRGAAHPDHGTFGSLFCDGVGICDTLEPYHRDNAVSVSCIPAGQYICKRYSSERYPDTFEVTGVHGRSKILFHTGNTDQDTEGCILLGIFGEINKDHGVLSSRVAFDRFRSYIGSASEFILTVVDAF